jgi:DNA-binding transcriptional LysR family regulator
VLAAPDTLRLDHVCDPERDLPPEAQEVLNRSIQFSFGTQHTKRVQAWYDSVIPGNWPFIQVRSFELALSMARAGLGVCLAPALAAATASGALEGVRLYRVHYPPRRIVAILPAHCARQQAHADLIAALKDAAEKVNLPEMFETPPFLREAPDN